MVWRGPQRRPSGIRERERVSVRVNMRLLLYNRANDREPGAPPTISGAREWAAPLAEPERLRDFRSPQPRF